MEIEKDIEWIGSHIETALPENAGSRDTINDPTGFRQLVSDVKGAMMADFSSDEMITNTEKKKGSFKENIMSWMALVEEDKDALKQIKARITFPGGKRRLDLKPEIDVSRAEDINERCSDSRLLYTLAIAQAKLDLVRGIATDVYPALESDFDKYAKELESRRSSLLGGDLSEEKKSVRTISLPGKVLVPTVSALVLLKILSYGCSSPVSAKDINSGNTQISEASSQSMNENPANPNTPLGSSQEADPNIPPEGTAERAEWLLKNGPITKEVPLTSDYIPGKEVNATLEEIVGPAELSINGATFTPTTLSEMKSNELASNETYGFISKKTEGNATVYTAYLFREPAVAEYEMSKEQVLNLFLITGNLESAKENLNNWGRDQLSKSPKDGESNPTIYISIP